MRKSITRITGVAVSDTVLAFINEPSSDNWSQVDKAMKAHQVACLAHEETLDIALAQIPKEETINALAKHFDDTAELVEKMCQRGHVRLIKSAIS